MNFFWKKSNEIWEITMKLAVNPAYLGFLLTMAKKSPAQIPLLFGTSYFGPPLIFWGSCPLYEKARRRKIEVVKVGVINKAM